MYSTPRYAASEMTTMLTTVAAAIDHGEAPRVRHVQVDDRPPQFRRALPCRSRRRDRTMPERDEHQAEHEEPGRTRKKTIPM